MSDGTVAGSANARVNPGTAAVSEDLAAEFSPRMGDSDALMWSIEKDPMLRSTITTVSFLDREPDRERLEYTMDRASRVIPRLRQRVRGHPYSIAPPRWETDPNFDLDYHLRFLGLGGNGSEEQVLRHAQPIAMQSFDRARPLWELHVVGGLVGGKGAIIQKIHHAITDGVGGMKLQTEILDIERDPEAPRPMPPVPEVHVASELERAVDALAWELRRQAAGLIDSAAQLGQVARNIARDPIGVAVGAANTAASVAKWLSPTLQPLSPMMGNRSLSVHFEVMTLPMADLKRAARVAGGKLNDAFVAGVIGGFSRYHDAKGYPVESLRMAMPINIREDSGSLRVGNQFSPSRIEVPADLHDPIATMTAVRRIVDQLKREPALSLTEPLAGIISRLPTTITTNTFGAMLRGIDFTTSNVPGPPFPVFVAGSEVLAQFAFGPMAGAGANLTLLSYQDHVNIGINADPASVTDVDLFIECLRESFTEVCSLG